MLKVKKENLINETRPHESGVKHVMVELIIQMTFLKYLELYMAQLDGVKKHMQ